MCTFPMHFVEACGPGCVHGKHFFKHRFCLLQGLELCGSLNDCNFVLWINQWGVMGVVLISIVDLAIKQIVTNTNFEYNISSHKYNCFESLISQIIACRLQVSTHPKPRDFKQ